MRETFYSSKQVEESVRALTGVRIKLKINRGRNKTELIEGILENAYPNIHGKKNVGRTQFVQLRRRHLQKRSFSEKNVT